MKKEGKNFSTCVNRISLIGDCVTSIAVLKYMRKLYPNCYNTFSIAKKCSQAILLFVQNPYIDRIHINEFLENPKEEELSFLKFHNIWASPNIQHPKQNWQNFYSIYEENFEMLGIDSSKLSKEDFEVKLVKWFNIEKYSKTIGIFGFAGYGDLKNKRSPSFDWWKCFIKLLLKSTDYTIFQFGHQSEPSFLYCDDEYKYLNRIKRFNDLEFFTQIKMSLGTDLCINTDSGTGLVLGGYNHPQITLLSNWNVGHIQNFTSLASNNKNSINIFKENDINLISHEKIIESIKILS